MNNIVVTVSGIILAGGRGSRMGGCDKGLLMLADKPMIEHIIAQLQPQVDQIIINANRSLDKYSQFGLPVITDAIGDYFGPLAGMLTALQYVETDYILTMPCDSPLLAPDYAKRMLAALQANQAQISVASDGERLQPVFALLPRSLADDLAAYLQADGRKIDRWYNRHNMTVVDFSDRPAMFRNINTPAELAELTAEFNQQ